MIKSKFFSVSITLLVGFTLSTAVVTPSASAGTIRTIWYDCNLSAPITLYVDPADDLAFNADCFNTTISVGSYNSSILENSFGMGMTTFIDVKSSATPGTYVNALDLYTTTHTLYTIIVRETVSVPSAPTLTSTAVGVNEITVNFSAGANGGATITDYKYSINGGSYISAGVTSGPISITGLSSNTTYSVKILARNSQGDGAASNSLTATTSLSAADIEAATTAAAKAAAVNREADKQEVRRRITMRAIALETISLELFTQAEISGPTNSNIAGINSEIALLPVDSRTSLSNIIKVARKYEVVAKIASDQVNRVYSSLYIEIGLIPSKSKNRTTLINAVKRLKAEDRNSYEAIKLAIAAEQAVIAKRAERLSILKARRDSGNGK